MNELSNKFYSYIEQTWTITEEQLNELKDKPQLSCIVSEEKDVVGIPETKFYSKLQIYRNSDEINEIPKIVMESAVLSRALWEKDEKDFKIEVGDNNLII
uniref:Uncharacterized protein n=1 Tax=Panagrolaimus davidi TaxID=227884 RepID=A0A914PBG3_9BILA